jgi:hypothetical protein
MTCDRLNDEQLEAFSQAFSFENFLRSKISILEELSRTGKTTRFNARTGEKKQTRRFLKDKETTTKTQVRIHHHSQMNQLECFRFTNARFHLLFQISFMRFVTQCGVLAWIIQGLFPEGKAPALLDVC